MNTCILTTGFNGNVLVTYPTEEARSFMTRGGGWFDHHERGIRGGLKYEIDKQVAQGLPEEATIRLLNAMAFGGCTDAEFYEIIRDRDCWNMGTMQELSSITDLPDRWFRDAWKRSANGGPVMIDLEKARPIQAQHIDDAIQRANSRPTGLLAELFPLKPVIEFNMAKLAQKIRDARDDLELRAVWPVELVT